MTVEYLKRAAKTASAEAESVSDTVKGILDEIEQGGESVARAYAAKFDQYNGPLMLDEEDIAAASAKVSQNSKTISRSPTITCAALPSANGKPCKKWRWKSSPAWLRASA